MGLPEVQNGGWPRPLWLSCVARLNGDIRAAVADPSRTVANPPKPAAGASNGNRAVASEQSADRPAEQHEQPGRQHAEVQQATATVVPPRRLREPPAVMSTDEPGRNEKDLGLVNEMAPTFGPSCPSHSAAELVSPGHRVLLTAGPTGVKKEYRISFLTRPPAL